jgi:RNA polymerase sigma factor (sigma-70 family)
MAAAEPLTRLVSHLRRRCGPAATDGDLIARFAVHRDESAFAELVDRYGRLVLGVARRHLPDRAAAEDVVQVTFLALAQNARRLGRPPSLANWLYAVAVRQAQTVRRRFVRQRALLTNSPRLTPPADPLETVTGRELITIIDDELAGMPERYRLPLLLCGLDGLTRDEAAQRLGWTTGTLHGRLDRGRELLRKRLTARGLTVPAVFAGGLLATPAEAMSAALARSVVRSAVEASAASTPGKLLVASATVLIAAGLGSTAAILAGDHPASNPPRLAAAIPGGPSVDVLGDPLPPGAFCRIGTVRFRHGAGELRTLLAAPDGRTVVSSGHYGDRVIRSWDLTTGRQLRQFPGYWDCDRTAALSHDGKVLAVPQDRDVCLWDLAAGTELARISVPVRGTVYALAFSPDGRTLAVGGRGQVAFVDLTARSVTARLTDGIDGRVSVLAYSPDGRTPVTGDHLGKSVLALWDTATRSPRHGLECRGSALSVCFSPNGRYLACGSERGAAPIWDVSTGTLVRELNVWQFTPAVAFSPDGQTLAAAEYAPDSSRGAVGLWDVAAGSLLRRFAVGQTAAHGIAFTRDGRTVITGEGGHVRLWDATTGSDNTPARGEPRWTHAVNVSPDGRTVAYLTAFAVRLADAATGQDLGELPGLPDGRPSVSVLALSPDGRRLACASIGPGGNAITVWDFNRRAVLYQIGGDRPSHTAGGRRIMDLKFTPDGSGLVAAGLDGSIITYDVAAGRERRRDSMPGRTFSSADSVAFTPDGRDAIATGLLRAGGGFGVRVWEAATGREKTALTTFVNAIAAAQPVDYSDYGTRRLAPRLALSADGRMFAVGGWPHELAVWELATGAERLRLRGHQEAVACAAFANGGRVLASAAWDGTVRIWDLDSGEQLAALTGHRGTVNSLAFTRDGRRLITGGDDATILVWDATRWTDKAGRSGHPSGSEWDDLAGSDPVAAYQAVRRLANSPDAALALFREKLPAASVVGFDQFRLLAERLDSPKFPDRQAAAKELDAVADRAADQMRRALAETKSAEVRRSLKSILDRLDAGAPETLRALRAVEVLEQIATSAAREHLKALAGGAPGATLTRAAAEALKRLGS